MTLTASKLLPTTESIHSGIIETGLSLAEQCYRELYSNLRGLHYHTGDEIYAAEAEKIKSSAENLGINTTSWTW